MRTCAPFMQSSGAQYSAGLLFSSQPCLVEGVIMSFETCLESVHFQDMFLDSSFGSREETWVPRTRTVRFHRGLNDFGVRMFLLGSNLSHETGLRSFKLQQRVSQLICSTDRENMSLLHGVNIIAVGTTLLQNTLSLIKFLSAAALCIRKQDS